MTLTVAGLWPNMTYAYTVTITSAAGVATATGTRPTATLKATVLCGDTSYCGSGIYVYSVADNANPSNAVGKLTAGTSSRPSATDRRLTSTPSRGAAGTRTSGSPDLQGLNGLVPVCLGQHRRL